MTRLLRYLTLLLFLAVGTPLFAQPCDCLTTGNCPVPIQDNGTFMGTLDVTVNGPNDLGACPLVSVCFTIPHTWVGDLSATLTSPAGLNYLIMADDNNNSGGCGTNADNIEVCILQGTFNPLTNNGPYTCNTGPCSVGTCCLTGNWSMPCGGVTDPISGAIQAPTCDLNDFNVAGHPANGTWTLTVNDICGADIGFLNNFTLTFACGTSSCVVCEAEGGMLNADDVASCFGDPSLNLSLPPNYPPGQTPDPAEYSYGYVISQNNSIIAVNPTSADMTSQPPGVYQVCGISYLTAAAGNLPTLVGMNLQVAQQQLASATAPFCADISDDCIMVTIGPVIPPTLIDTMVCLGDCINVGGQQLCNSGEVNLTSYLGCDSTIIVVMIPIFVDPTTVQIPVCQNECVDIAGQLVCPPGNTLTFENYQGCDSIVTYILIEEITQAVILPNPPEPLDCLNPAQLLDGSASIPFGPMTSYQWSGPNGPFSNDPSVFVDEPGTYTLTVSNNNLSPACTSTVSVEIEGSIEGPELQVNTSPVICEGDTYDLATLNIVDLNNTDPEITFHSDTPAVPGNELPSTLVSPGVTTTYYILGVTGNCSDEIPVTVTVDPIPTADFTAESPICVDMNSEIVYTGTAGPGATYNWNFGGGVANPGTGPGPHTVTWATGGLKTITLVVEENGCTSASSSESVMVDSPLSPPVLICDPSIDGVSFSWGDVPGASGYNVTVTPAIGSTSMPTPTTLEVTGLTPGEQVTINVEAISGGACANTFGLLTCTAQDCPTVELNIDPVDDICLDASAAPITLVVSQTGGAGGGSFTFSGPGVNPFTGEFDPTAANLGSNVIQVTYEEGTCVYSNSITIIVNPQPTADFTVTSPICVDGSSTVNYTGSASGGAVFMWDFAGGTADPGTGPGPHSVTWPDAGSYTISLQVEEDDCASEMNTMSVDVDAVIPEPQVTCDANTSSVEFFWTNVPGADDYEVTVLAGSGGVMTSDTSILFDGLTPNTIISIEITANGSGACGSTIVQANCEAQDCPPVVIDVEPVPGICLDASAAPVDLSIEITGSVVPGTTVVTGPGITDPAGTFDPASANIGGNLITVTYTEGNCEFTETLNIDVFDLPVSSFTVDSPICETDEATVTFDGDVVPGLSFTWDFGTGTASPGVGQGPHTVTWPDSGPQTISLILENGNGCVAEEVTQVVQVDEELIAPMIACSSTTTSVEFSWPTVAGAVDYEVVVLSGPTGVFDPVANTYSVSSLVPNDEVTIQLTITGGGACPPVVVEETCVAVDCPPVSITIDPVPGICLSNTVPSQLIGDPAGGTWSGPGIIDPDLGIFDPQAAGVGNHPIVYAIENGPCLYDNSIFIEVFGEPSAEFTASQNICVTDVANVEYIGNASPTANYTWDFGGGTADPGTGPGPHTVTWPADGNYTITLSVEQDGCVSQTVNQAVQVDPELTPPSIGCGVTTGSVTFDWDDVPGATDYEVTVISGASGTVAGNTYQVDGLVPGDEICIELTVSGPTACGPVSMQQCCTAEDCPPVSLVLDPVGPFCFDATVPATSLIAEVTGGSGAGSGSWSGPGVDSNTGEFDPAAAGVGNHVLTFVYDENDNCSFEESINVEVVAPPIADAGTDAELTCQDDQLDATLGGDSSTGPNISYEWTASSGSFPADSSLLNPVVSVPGTYTLTVTNTDLGCSTTDEVVVTASQELPSADVSLTPVSCYGQNDGGISIMGVDGGEPPYLYSLNGAPFDAQSNFAPLEPGIYSLAVLDANGCENTITLDITQPQEVDVELVVVYDGEENVVRLGDAVELIGLSTISEDSLETIQWEPAELVDCDTCLNVTAEPTQQTTFSITIEDNGCTDSDAVTLFVSKEYNVYVPNGFSPNDDGTNDVFLVYGDEDEIVAIRSFLVFSRWGEAVHEFYNIPPNQPAFGWDGTYRGQVMDPAVFTWFAEVEFVDGRVELFEGDVNLVK